jgi:hypothetical protein
MVNSIYVKVVSDPGMEKPSVKCALLATMIAKHKWRTPIPEDALLNLSAIDVRPLIHHSSLRSPYSGPAH